MCHRTPLLTPAWKIFQAETGKPEASLASGDLVEVRVTRHCLGTFFIDARSASGASHFSVLDAKKVPCPDTCSFCR